MSMRAFSLGLLLVASAAGACATETTPDHETTNLEREALGKADAVGSCQNPAKDFCGGKGTGNCWCDELCVEFEDCCSDADEVCGIEIPEPEAVPCGARAGDTCSDDEYCAYENGQYCGAADAQSTCQPRPQACIQLYSPVCGCDGQTYSNSCFAAGAGTGVLHTGECEPPPPGGFCGGFGGFPCPPGQLCVDDPADDCDPENGGADCGGVCVLDEPEPEPEPEPGPTCEGTCGGPALGAECWCDDLCESFGDCCSDHAEHCA